MLLLTAHSIFGIYLDYLGDHGYKQNKSLGPEEQMISPLPDVRSLALTPKDSFMIVACDGIWNSLTSQEACDFVSMRIQENMKLSKICEEVGIHFGSVLIHC